MAEEQERGVFRESDLARKFCRGEGERFKGERCEHFDILTWECSLLRDMPIVAVFGKRCLSKQVFFEKAQDYLKEQRRIFLDEDIDIEDFIFGHDYGDGRKGILEYKVKFPAIHNMYSLINMSLGQEIERTLKRRGLAPWDKKCGTCDHRALLEPHSCQLEYFPTKTPGRPHLNRHFGTERTEGDAPCDGYLPMVSQDVCRQPKWEF